jgi:hypothetical protein
MLGAHNVTAMRKGRARVENVNKISSEYERDDVDDWRPGSGRACQVRGLILVGACVLRFASCCVPVPVHHHTRQLPQIANMFPDNQRPALQPQDDAAMQVDTDESVVPHQSYTSTPMPHTLPSSQSTVSIPEDALKPVYSVLELLINPSHSDEDIGNSMSVIHYNVYGVLGKDPALRTRRANEVEFLQNVEKKGKKQVIDAFRDAAEKKIWRKLVSNGTFSFLLTSIILTMFCRQMYFSRLQLYKDHKRSSL